jgi:iron complex transport system substrate-binding protein
MAAGAAGCLGLACGRAETPRIASSQPATTTLTGRPFIDPAERAVACPRIVAAAPSVSEICCALGLLDGLVGRTRYCDYPPALMRVPEIGGLDDLNAERLLGLQPELIILSGASRAQAEKLQRLRLAFLSAPDVALDDLYTAIGQIGAHVGRSRTAARLSEAIRRDLATVTARHASEPKRRVLVLTGPLSDPPAQAFVAGPGSFYADLLRLAGHENAGDPADKPFTTASLEFILRADPDVIIELTPTAAERPGGDRDARRVWAKVGPLKAVAGRRVRVLVGSQHFILGPRIAQTLEQLCTLVAEPSHE